MKINLEKKELLKEINKIIESNILVIVEGKKDKNALNNLGINNIKTLDRALFKIIESVNENEIILLTDLDKEGRKLFNKLNYYLQRRGINVNKKLRGLLFNTALSHIEGLDSYLSNERNSSYIESDIEKINIHESKR